MWSLALRRGLGASAGRASASLRYLSTEAPLTVLEPVDELAPATRILRLTKPPVNSMNLELLQSICASIAEAEADKACRAVVLASARPGVFSAGLEITEMCHPEPERLRSFWWSVQELFLKLSTSRVATVAAIEGHSPAGGCLMALSCDWRVMSTADPVKQKPFTIGLNETKLGIVAPFWFADTFKYVIGERQADILLQTGALVTAEHAAGIGLVDEATAHDQVMSAAAAKVKELLSVPDRARHQTKMLQRGPVADRLLEKREADIEAFTSFVLSPPVQASLDKYMEALKASKAKGKK